jgi:hypothetical protein
MLPLLFFESFFVENSLFVMDARTQISGMNEYSLYHKYCHDTNCIRLCTGHTQLLFYNFLQKLSFDVQICICEMDVLDPLHHRFVYSMGLARYK